MRRALTYLPSVIFALCCMAMIAHGPIQQTENYHAFADNISLLGLPNTRDVISNLGFALIGLWGIVRLWPQRKHPAIARGWPGFALFLIGLTLTALGSTYYHLAPDNARLLWDRLPIALACAGLLAGVWAQTALPAGRANLATGLLAVYAIGSVLWWYYGELNGQGDLRPYELAPAYDMLPMAFAPRASGELPNSLPAPTLDSQVATVQWQTALVLNRAYLVRLREENGFSEGFADCIAALEAHLAAGEMRIGRLG